MSKHMTEPHRVVARSAAGVRARIFLVGLLVAVIATGASMLAWVPGRTETGIAALEISVAPATALTESDRAGPQSTACYACSVGGGAVAGYMA